MRAPTFDQHGYPTTETLDAIAVWDYHDLPGLFQFMADAWHWADFVSDRLRPEEAVVAHVEDYETVVRFATGGWFGNEELIYALRRNHLVWGFTWRLSTCGGLHIFGYTRRNHATVSGDVSVS